MNSVLDMFYGQLQYTFRIGSDSNYGAKATALIQALYNTTTIVPIPP